jgi:hypothetical protein
MAENAMPDVDLIEETTVRIIASSNPEQIARQVTEIENQPYTEAELKQSITRLPYTKTSRRYTIDGQQKSIITLRVFSTEDRPNAVIADFNPGASSAPTTVTTSQGSITYFKGLSSGENIFEYVIEGEVSETMEPVVFTMKTLNQAEKTLKNITGFTIGVPGVFEVPVVFIGIGAIILLVLKFLI